MLTFRKVFDHFQEKHEQIVHALLLKLKCRKLRHCKNLVIHSSSGVSSGSTSSDTASNEDKNASHGPHSPTPSSSSSQGTVKRAGPNSAANSVISNNVNNKSSENNSVKSSGGQLVRPRHLKQRKEVFKVVFLHHTAIIHIFHLVSLFLKGEGDFFNIFMHFLINQFDQITYCKKKLHTCFRELKCHVRKLANLLHSRSSDDWNVDKSFEGCPGLRRLRPQRPKFCCPTNPASSIGPDRAMHVFGWPQFCWSKKYVIDQTGYSPNSGSCNAIQMLSQGGISVSGDF